MIQGGSTASFFLNFLDFNSLILRNSEFIGSQVQSLQKNWIWLTTAFGKVDISFSKFVNLSAINGGALFLSLPIYLNAIVSNCSFVNNTGQEMAGDIGLDVKTPDSLTFDKLKGFKASVYVMGVQYNQFENSAGGVGGSITLMEGVQFVIVGNRFLGAKARVGGAFYLKEKSQAIVYDNYFEYIKSEESGGVIAVYGGDIVIDSVTAVNMNSSKGGFLFSENSNITLRYVNISRVMSVNGGFVYVTSCSLSIAHGRFSALSVSSSGGVFYLKKGLSIIADCLFLKAKAIFQGTLVYADSMESLVMKRLTTRESEVNEGGIYIAGKVNVTYILEDFNCESSLGHGKGTCLMTKDAYLKITRVTAKASSSFYNAFHFYSSIKPTNIFLKDFLLIGNKNRESTFYFSKVKVVLDNLTITSGLQASVKDSYIILLYSSSQLTLTSFTYSNPSQTETVLYTVSSSLYMRKSKLQLARRASGLVAELATLDLADCHFEFGLAVDTDSFGGSLRMFRSNITLLRVNLTDSKARLGGAIYSSESNLNIKEGVFLRNRASENGSEIYMVGNTSLKIENTIVFDTYSSSLFLASILAAGLKNCSFVQLTETSALSQGLFVFNAISVSIKDSLFRGFRQENPIKLKSTNEYITSTSFSITGCVFEDNIAQYSGGALHLDFETALVGEISGSVFRNNTSGSSGGAIYYRCPYQACDLKISNSLFERNSAQKYAAVIKSDDINQDMSANNKFANNYAPGGSPILVTYPSKILIFQGYSNEETFWKAINRTGVKELSKKTLVGLTGLVSGKEFTIACMITDDMGNFFANDTGPILSFEVPENINETINLENEEQQINRGVAFFPKLKVIARPNKSREILILYKNENEDKYFNRTIGIGLRPCIKGEIFSGLICKPCNEKFYSLDSNPLGDQNENNQKEKVCEACPDHADCPGRHIIIPQKDYWRRDDNQSKIVKCPISNACQQIEAPKPGSVNFESDFEKFEFKPLCQLGYFGNLCYNCDNNYGRSAEKDCLKCSQSDLLYVRFVLMSLMSILFMIYQTRSAFSITMTSSKRRALIKLLVDHLSYISFISRFNIEWSSFVYDLFSNQDKFITTVPVEIFNFDCFFNVYVERDNVFIVNVVLVSLSPLLFGLLTLAMLYAGYGVMNIVGRIKSRFFKKSEEEVALPPTKKEKIPFSKNFLSICLVLFYNFYPRLLINAFHLLKCIQIDDSVNLFLEANPEMECWGNEHVFYVFTIALPNLIIWGVGTPAILMYITHKMHKNKSEAAKSGYYNNLLSYLTIDYVGPMYFWEIFTYLSKFVVVSGTVATSRFDAVSQGAVLILIFLLMFLIQERLRPYRFDFINDYKTCSYLTAICTAAFAIMASNNIISPNQRASYLMCLLIVNGLFYLGWFYYLVQNIREQSRELVKQMRADWKDYKDRRTTKLKSKIEAARNAIPPKKEN